MVFIHRLEGHNGALHNFSLCPFRQSRGFGSFQGVSKLETLLNKKTDERFDKFELFCIKHLFSLPEDLDIRLPYQEVGLDRESVRVARHPV